MTDLHVAFDAFVGVMFAEVVVKPIAVRVGREILRRADLHIKFIPNWLWNNEAE